MSGLAGVAPVPRSWENTVVTVSPSPLPAAELAEAPEQQRSATVVEESAQDSRTHRLGARCCARLRANAAFDAGSRQQLFFVRHSVCR